MSIVAQLTTQLEGLATAVPVEIFVSLGAFIEELIAPIPSPIVMTISGTIALAQQKPVAFLFYLALIGSIGKIIGSWLLYLISDKLEDVIVGKFGKFFGITHKEIESIGRHFNGSPRDDIIIFLARAIPIVPTAPVSIICGVIKVKMRTYLVSSFFGNLIRSLFYLYVGYGGLAGYEYIMEKMDSLESALTVTLALIIMGGGAVWWYYKNKDKLVDKLRQKTLDKQK